MASSRIAFRAPYRVMVRSDTHVQDCPLATGDEGWLVYLCDCDRFGLEYSDLSPEGIAEVKAWMRDTLGLDNETIDDSVYLWGVTFEHEDQALLCFLAFK